MAKEEITPSEWQIMEVLWEAAKPLTSAEVYRRLQGSADMSQRMVRVLMNRLGAKGLLGYTVDTRDARVYHYYVTKPKEACGKRADALWTAIFPETGPMRWRRFCRAFRLRMSRSVSWRRCSKRAGRGAGTL